MSAGQCFEELKGGADSHPNKQENQRLHLFEHISTAQRMFLQATEASVVLDFLLSYAVELMDSGCGFVSEAMNEDGKVRFKNVALFDRASSKCVSSSHENTSDNKNPRKFDNPFGGHIITSLISNNPMTDETILSMLGCQPLHNFMSIPIFETSTNDLIGMVGMANNPRGYATSDVEFLEPFIATCSALIQANRAKQQNLRLINTLEEKVRERTCELALAKERLSEVNQDVQHASETQLDKIFACLSHELRTPLNCIVGISSLLLESGLTSRQQDLIQMVSTSGELLSSAVTDILDYSRLVRGQVEVQIQPTDLQELLDEVLHSIETKASDRNIKVRTNFHPQVPEMIHTDGKRVRQILYNVLGSSCRFSKDNGDIEFGIRIVERKHPNPRAKHPPNRSAPLKSRQEGVADKLLRFSVKDYGAGIASEHMPNIFLPFMQATAGDIEKFYCGTGGQSLSVTSKLVEALGGAISVESQVCEWSEFTIDIPFHGLEADPKVLSERLCDTQIIVVGDEERRLCELGNPYNLDIVNLASCNELGALVKTNGTIRDAKSCVCLVHEDLHKRDVFAAFRQSATGTTTRLLTFGPRYSVKDERCMGHYRSLSHMLPSALAKSLLMQHWRSPSSVNQKTTEEKPLATHTSRNRYDSLEVLVAEDNAVNQKVMRNILQKIGVKNLEFVDNGKKAVDRTREKDFDLILMDAQMPVMDGFEATRQILWLQQDDGQDCGHTNTSNRPTIVFVTANTDEESERQAKQAGGSCLIPKPFNLQTMEKFLASFWTEPNAMLL